MKFKRAIQIGTLSQAFQFLLSFGSVIVVSRLLQPEEIGIFSVAVSLIGFAHVFREFGVGQYLIQVTEVRREHFRAAFTVALASAWLIALTLVVLSQPMARLYGNDGVGEVMLLAGLNFAVMPFGTPLLAILRRELRFGTIEGVAVVGTLVQTGVTLTAAWQGQGYLSMAWGALAMTLTKVLLFNLLRPGQTLVLPTTRGLREVLRFGTLASSASMMTAVGDAAPDLILGKAQGFGEVALFSRATSIQVMLVGKINELVRSVHLPMFAARVRDGAAPAPLFAEVSGHLAVITLPALLFFAVVADPLIVFVFGPQWARSADLASVLCLAACLSAPMALYGPSLIATGHVRLFVQAVALVQTIRIGVLLCAFWWPLEALAKAQVAVDAFEALVAQRQLARAYGLTAQQTLSFLWRPWLAALAAAAGPSMIKLGVAAGAWPAMAPLAQLLASGILAVAGWTLVVVMCRHPIREHVPLLRSR